MSTNKATAKPDARTDTRYAAAIKAANWAIYDDPNCQASNKRLSAAKLALEAARRHEIEAARTEYERALAQRLSLTKAVFRRVMTRAGY